MGNFSTFFVISYAEIQDSGQKCNSKKVMDQDLGGEILPRWPENIAGQNMEHEFCVPNWPFPQAPLCFPPCQVCGFGCTCFYSIQFSPIQTLWQQTSPTGSIGEGFFLVSDVPFRNKTVERHQLRHLIIGFQTMSSQIAATGIRKAIFFGINGIHFRFCSDYHPRNRKW